MSDRSVMNVLGQVQPSEAGAILRDWLRGEVRGLIADLMAEEVTALCGVPYHPSAQSDCRRAGSSPMRVRIDGRNAEVRRPRVRRHSGDGSTGEVALSTVAAARHADDLRESILRAFAAGVSSRDQRTLHGAESASRSTVSRIWVVEGRRRIEQLRERDLGRVQFFALVLDGIALSEDLSAIVALGITLDGSKVLLDFEIGAQESTGVCDDLLDRLVTRGLAFRGRPLAVLDGSDALRKSLLRHFPDAAVQRCLVHKERNIKGCLSRRRHGEVTRLFRRLRYESGSA